MIESHSLKPLSWTTLWWLTDNANVEKMLAKGSGKLRITCLVLEILLKGRELQYDVHPIWVCRDNLFLQKADCLSKGIHSNNWSIDKPDFLQLSEQFGPFSVDLFATCKNRKVICFNSRSFEKRNYGTDAFLQRWDGECIYAAPPATIDMRTIRKAAILDLNGIIIVPLWKGARFWTYAYRDGLHLNGLFESMHIVRMRTHA
jgi:hypothetical protein